MSCKSAWKGVKKAGVPGRRRDHCPTPDSGMTIAELWAWTLDLVVMVVLPSLFVKHVRASVVVPRTQRLTVGKQEGQGPLSLTKLLV